ncbi:MAG: hypothetical protein HC838_07930 [Spirulinaceae cyanobacterium RM2_2_10]|nr:hypothetical protein [Spirulinaceae cyanobacterium RM2_2_10]
MSTPSPHLQAGRQALEAHRYADAVCALEQYCREVRQPGSRSDFQARMWLIKAYQKMGKRSRRSPCVSNSLPVPPPLCRLGP